MSEARLRLEEVSVSFGGVLAVDRASLTVDEGEILALVGPRGCGKSSFLKAIAGLEPIAAGSIACAGRRIDRLPPHRRGVGVVFPDCDLFPHMRVSGNVGFGLRMQRADGSREERVAKMLDLLQIGALADSWPDQLSGGERQRVALARALAPEPTLLLLDEPFSALEQPMRAAMRIEIRTLLKSLGLATIIVTRDQEEALSMADRVALMRGGRMEQIGSSDDIYRRPANLFVAGFMGRVSLLNAKVAAMGGETLTARLPDGYLVQAKAPGVRTGAGEPVVLAVRPEAVRVMPPGGVAYAVRVTERIFMGERTELRCVNGAGQVITALLGPGQAAPPPDTSIGLLFDAAGAFAFPANSPEPATKGS